MAGIKLGNILIRLHGLASMLWAEDYKEGFLKVAQAGGEAGIFCIFVYFLSQ